MAAGRTLQNADHGVKHGRTTNEMKPRCDLAMLWSLRSHNGDTAIFCSAAGNATSERGVSGCSANHHPRAYTSHHLSFRVALQVELLRDQVRPPNVQPRGARGVRHVCALEHKLQQQQLVLVLREWWQQTMESRAGRGTHTRTRAQLTSCPNSGRFVLLSNAAM